MVVWLVICCSTGSTSQRLDSYVGEKESRRDIGEKSKQIGLGCGEINKLENQTSIDKASYSLKC